MDAIAQRSALVAARLPGPGELFPGRPDAVIDLQTEEGTELVGATWRYSDAEVREIEFVAVGSPMDPLGPGDVPNRTYDVVPHAEAADFGDSAWRVLAPAETMLRLGNGRVSFNWYRVEVTIPERIGDFDPTGSTAIFEVVVDDYAEVWVNGALARGLGQSGGSLVAGFNAPNRVVLTRNAQAGQSFDIAVFAANGPLSDPPANYIWVRSATIDFYRPRPDLRTAEVRVDRRDRRLASVLPAQPVLESLAGGFQFTEGPVWVPAEHSLLFSDPNDNTIYRWSEDAGISVFRVKSGYTGADIGEYHQPGSNGLALDPQGRLTIDEHGNRRVTRLEKNGVMTVLADRYEGRRFNSPNDLVYKSDGALYFTDPPFGLPKTFDDPRKELPYSGVFRWKDGEVTLLATDLVGPNGIAFSPDERYLYVTNWDPTRKLVMRYDVVEDGTLANGRIFFDMTAAPGEEALDGVKVDAEGNLFVSGPGGVWIIAADGTHLGTVRLPELAANMAWGDQDGRSLFLTARTGLYRLRTLTGRRPFPAQGTSR